MPMISMSPSASSAYPVMPPDVTRRRSMRVLEMRMPVAFGLRVPSARLSGPLPTNSSSPSPWKPSPLKLTVPSIVTKSPIVILTSLRSTANRARVGSTLICWLPTVTMNGRKSPVPGVSVEAVKFNPVVLILMPDRARCVEHAGVELELRQQHAGNALGALAAR